MVACHHFNPFSDTTELSVANLPAPGLPKEEPERLRRRDSVLGWLPEPKVDCPGDSPKTESCHTQPLSFILTKNWPLARVGHSEANVLLHPEWNGSL